MWVTPFMLLVLLLRTWARSIIWDLYQVAWCKEIMFFIMELTATLISCNCAPDPFQVSIKWRNKRMFGESEATKHHLQFSHSYLLKILHKPHHIIALNNYASHSLVLLTVFFGSRFCSLNKLTFPYCLRTCVLLFLPYCSKLEMQLKLAWACLNK